MVGVGNSKKKTDQAYLSSYSAARITAPEQNPYTSGLLNVTARRKLSGSHIPNPCVINLRNPHPSPHPVDKLQFKCIEIHGNYLHMLQSRTHSFKSQHQVLEDGRAGVLMGVRNKYLGFSICTKHKNCPMPAGKHVVRNMLSNKRRCILISF